MYEDVFLHQWLGNERSWQRLGKKLRGNANMHFLEDDKLSIQWNRSFDTMSLVLDKFDVLLFSSFYGPLKYTPEEMAVGIFGVETYLPLDELWQNQQGAFVELSRELDIYGHISRNQDKDVTIVRPNSAGYTVDRDGFFLIHDLKVHTLSAQEALDNALEQRSDQRYQVFEKDNTLVFKYADGRREKFAFSGEEEKIEIIRRIRKEYRQ